MKEKMKAFFKQIKWWEYTFMSVFIVAIVVSGIVFKSSALTIFCSLFGIVGVFFIAKGMLIGQMISIVYGALYATMSYFNHLYGEMIVTLAVTIPLLDEPTAALDPKAEYEIYRRFNDLVADRTTVYISHRMSSCRFCGDIAVFHEGRMVQRGTHESLMEETGGKYYELWTAQARYYQNES